MVFGRWCKSASYAVVHEICKSRCTILPVFLRWKHGLENIDPEKLWYIFTSSSTIRIKLKLFVNCMDLWLLWLHISCCFEKMLNVHITTRGWRRWNETPKRHWNTETAGNHDYCCYYFFFHSLITDSTLCHEDLYHLSRDKCLCHGIYLLVLLPLQSAILLNPFLFIIENNKYFIHHLPSVLTVLWFN